MKFTSWILIAVGGICVASMAAAPHAPRPPGEICAGDQCAAADSSTSIQALSATAFVDSIGVNVRFSNHKTPYVTSFPLAKEKLLALGVRHVRDAAVDKAGGFNDRDQAALFREIGEAGVRVAFVFGPGVSQAFVQGFPARVAPAFEAYELPNEMNAARPDWVQTLRGWAPQFQSYIRSNPATARYPIIGPSLTDKGDNPSGALGDLSGYFDFGNTHAYYSSREPGTQGWGRPGAPPCNPWRYGSTEFNLCNARRVSGQKPVMSTETGWLTDVESPSEVPEDLQAKYLVRMLLLHFDAGIARTYIYQLMDSGSDGFRNSGLVTAIGEERPAFKEIRTLISTLQGGKSVEHPVVVPLALSGDTTSVRKMAFQKSDGTVHVILWLEEPGMDPITRQRQVVTPANVTMRAGNPYRVAAISAFADNGDLQSIATTRPASADQALMLTDALTIVELRR
ncbi:MAG: hypothetical protein WDO56_09280 [Gammaproteobacteria bacterium]